MTRLTWRQAIGWRMQQHRLHQRGPKSDLLLVAAEHGGLHAQVMSSAGLIAAARLEGIREGDIEHLLWEDRKLIKTWAMRHTLHLLPAATYWKWVGAASSVPYYMAPSWLRQLRLKSGELDAVIAAVGAALTHQPLLRSELAAEVARLTGIPRMNTLMQESWGLLLKPPCFAGHLCFAEGEGARSRFTHPSVHLRRKAPVRMPNGLLELAHTFFDTCGPASTRELSRWLALDVRLTRDVMSKLNLEPVSIEGHEAWLPPAHIAEARNATPVRTVRLLPSFDPYVFAAGLTPDRFLRGGDYKQIYKVSAWYAPVLFAEGGFHGVWRMDKKGDRLVITIEPFRSVPAWLRTGAEEEAERLAQSMDRTAELVWRKP